MLFFILFLLFLISTLFIYKSKITKHLAIENLALRHQISVLERTSKKPRLKNRDRIFWIFLVRFWKGWKQAVIIMEPETIIKWHRKGFKTYWKLKSKQKRKPGRPKLSREIRQLIKDMANYNTLWGAPRVHGELQKLGLDVSERCVSNYLKQITRKPPSLEDFFKKSCWESLYRFFYCPHSNLQGFLCFYHPEQ